MFNKVPRGSNTIHSKNKEVFRTKVDPRKDDSILSHKPLNKSMRPAKPGGDKLNVSMQTQQSETKEAPREDRVMDRLCQ